MNGDIALGLVAGLLKMAAVLSLPLLAALRTRRRCFTPWATPSPARLPDLIALSHDIFRIQPEAIPGMQTSLTMVDGKVVYDGES